MQGTKSLINTNAPGIKVHLVETDLGKLDTVESTFAKAASYANETNHQQMILLHNAGSVGTITKPAIEITDPQLIQDHLGVNYTSMFVLTSHFLSRFKTGHRVIINHTSTAAFKFIPSLSQYSACKAARNAYMGVLAVENPDVRVLSCSPGPVDTDMLQTIKNDSYAGTTTSGFRERYASNQVSSCRENINKFVQLLKEDKFESGANIDFRNYS